MCPEDFPEDLWWKLQAFLIKIENQILEGIAGANEAQRFPNYKDDEIVLFGFEGQVDRVVKVPDFPDRYYLPIQVRPTIMVEEIPYTSMRVAEYQRASEHTYIRIK